MNAKTDGQTFANMIRTYFGVGPRTRKNAAKIKRDMVEAIGLAIYYPGYYNDEQTAIFRTAAGAFYSYEKHIEGYRVSGMVRYEIEQMSPYRFAGFLGEMVDAGITNVGEGERFFSEMARGQVAA